MSWNETPQQYVQTVNVFFNNAGKKCLFERTSFMRSYYIHITSYGEESFYFFKETFQKRISQVHAWIPSSPPSNVCTDITKHTHGHTNVTWAAHALKLQSPWLGHTQGQTAPVTSDEQNVVVLTSYVDTHDAFCWRHCELTEVKLASHCTCRHTFGVNASIPNRTLGP